MDLRGTSDPGAPECGPTLSRLQGVLDGDPAEALDADPHPLSCPRCRERVRAARVLLGALAGIPAPTPVPSGLTARILAGVRADRASRLRRRVIAGGLAAAAILVAVLLLNSPGQQPVVRLDPGLSPAPPADPSPAPPGIQRAPEPRPVRIGEELAKAGEALKAAPRPITEPAGAAPRVIASLTSNWLTAPPVPASHLEQAGKSLADLPAAAREGLEPVTGSVSKAFISLRKNVEAVQPPSNP